MPGLYVLRDELEDTLEPRRGSPDLSRQADRKGYLLENTHFKVNTVRHSHLFTFYFSEPLVGTAKTPKRLGVRPSDGGAPADIDDALLDVLLRPYHIAEHLQSLGLVKLVGPELRVVQAARVPPSVLWMVMVSILSALNSFRGALEPAERPPKKHEARVVGVILTPLLAIPNCRIT